MYIIKEKEGIVIYIMKNTMFDVVDFLNAKDRWLSCEDINKCLINDTYKGIAKCHPNDRFDVEKGKEIAKARAVYKHNRAFYNKVKAYIKKSEEENLRMMKVANNKYEKSIDRLEKIIINFD